MPGPNGEECGGCTKFNPLDQQATYGHCLAKGSGFKLCEARAAQLVMLGIAPNLDTACRSPLAWYAPVVFFFDWCVDEFVAKPAP